MKVLIGLCSFNDLEFLKESVPVLEKLRAFFNESALQDDGVKMSNTCELVVFDGAWNDEVKNFFSNNYPAVNYIKHAEGNVGYGRAYGEILKQFPAYDYFLLVTSDVILDFESVQKILEEMEQDKELILAAGKFHYFDFATKTRMKKIDSLGICAKKRHHFYDRGQGEVDSGQYDEKLQNFFGLTGAAFIIRVAVLPELFGNSWQIFDDRMWMYKEDVDLSYRLRRLGKKMKIFPFVWAWHARTVQKNIPKKPYAILHSYKNHILLLKNNFSLRLGAMVFLHTFAFELAKAIYMLILHPRVLVAGMKTLFGTPPKRSVRKVKTSEILKLFE